VVAARIRDDAALAFLQSEGRDLVVGSAQLECTDGLQVFKLQKKPPCVARIGDLSRDIDGRRVSGDSVQTGMRLLDIFESDDGGRSWEATSCEPRAMSNQ
jgi:hypothetical protein